MTIRQILTITALLTLLPAASFAQTTSFLGESQFMNASNAFATGTEGTFVRSTDAGQTWTPVSPGLPGNVLGAAFSGVNTGVVAVSAGAGGSTLLRTTDGGASWTYTGSSSNTLQAVCWADANTVVAAGNTGTILRSTDGGVTWTTQTSGTTNNLYDVDFTDVNTGTAVGAYGFITRTTDAGMTWTSQASGIVYYLRSVDFIDANVGTAVGDQSNIVWTTNGGATWVKQTSPVSSLIFYSVALTDQNNGLVAGQGGKILRTTNGGATWVDQANPSSTLTLASISFGSASVAVATGGSGTILRTTDGGATWTKVAPSGSTASVTVTTEPAGRSFTVDGLSYSSGQTFTWDAGSVHTVSTTSPQSGSAGTQYVFSGWSDGGAISHSYTTPSVATTLTASFSTVTSTPGAFTLASPANGSTNQPVSGTLVWKSSSNASAYDVYLGTTNPPSLAASNRTDTTYTYSALSYGKAYYWKVVAKNGAGTATTGVWKFTTMRRPSTKQVRIASSTVALSLIREDGTRYGTVTLYNEGDVDLVVSEIQTFNPSFSASISSRVITPFDSSTVTISARTATQETAVAVLSYQGLPEQDSITAFTSDPLAVDERTGRAETFVLRQNYPNPFNPTTSIGYFLPAGAHVSLIVVNELGQVVAKVVDAYSGPGEHSVEFDATALPSGPYLYVLTAGDHRESGRMLLLR